MKPFKDIFLILIFLFSTSLTIGQSLIDTHAGFYTTFLSSQALQSVPGIGLEVGKRSQAKMSPRFDFFSDYAIYFTSFGIKGYTVTETGVFDTVVTHTTSTFYKVGLNYALGVDYFILPDQLSIGAGPALSLNDVLLAPGSNRALLGTVPRDAVATAPATTTDQMGGFLIDYGVHINVVYRLPKVQFSISYFKGFNSLTTGFSTTSNDIELAVHFNLMESSFAKPYQNKIVK